MRKSEFEISAVVKFAKRVMDLALGVVLLVICAPLILLLAAWIRLDSPGPAFFWQERIGYRTKRFSCLKFRTMRAGASDDIHRQIIHEMMTQDASESKTVNKLVDDPRLTRAGRWLRKLSLDELPQLWNVMRGEMSLVGPRPAIEYELPYHDDRMLRRFNIKPGITGYWQVKSRYAVDYRKMVEMDLHYLEHHSIGLDLQILFLTVRTVFKRTGA